MNRENRYQPPQAYVADVETHVLDDLASRGARLGGALLDGLLMIAIIFPAMFVTGVWENAIKNGGTMTVGAQVSFGLAALALYFLMHGYLLHRYGQTIGKRVAGTRIVSVDDNRVLPLWKVFALRQLPVTIAGQIPIVGQLAAIVDILFVFRGDKRCIHDLIAGTKVVRATIAWKGSAATDNAE